MKCSKCGFEYRGNFCPNCGTHVTADINNERKKTYCANCGKVSESRICKHCGVKNRVVHNYCSWCGMKLNPHAIICTNCQEKVSDSALWTVLMVLWIVFTAFLVVGFTFIDNNPIGGLIFVIPMVLSFPFVGKFIKKITHNQPMRKAKRLILNIARIALAIFLLFPAYSIAIRIDTPTSYNQNNPNTLSSYTYDEYVMYSTMTKGYVKALDSLKNPKTADFLGVSYSPESEMVYFCVIAENSFGANTKCYIAYSKQYDKIDEGDDRKYYYESAEIQKTMDDLFTFMEAAKNSDDDNVPKSIPNEKLAEYSSEEKAMYEMFIEGIDWINMLYDDVLVVYCKYDSKTKDVYFEFSGTEKYSNKIILSYAWYNNIVGLEVGEQYKEAFENADITHYEFEVEDYKEAKKKDIS